MEQHKKPSKIRTEQLASTLGQFVVTPPNKNRWQRFLFCIAGNRRRLVASSALAGLVVIAGGLSVMALATSINFSSVRLGQTTLNVRQPDTVLQQQIAAAASNYEFAVSYPDGSSKTYHLRDAGISINSAASVQQARQTIRDLGWQRFNWRHSTVVPLTITKNNQQYNAFITNHVAIANVAPKDATLTVSAGQPVISDGVNGSTYQLNGNNKQLVAAATSLQPLRTKLISTTVAPAVQRSDLTASAAKVSSYTSHSVSFTIADRTVTASPTDIGTWLDLDAAPAHKTVDVSVNSGKVQAYLDKMTASSIYPARAQITTTAADGTVTVLAAGQDGSAIANKAAVVKSITDQLQQTGNAITADLQVTHDSFKTINAADYPKWLIADVTAKRMYAYEHNQLVRSFLISAGAPKTPTVLGTYQIYSKLAVHTMRGANADGSRYVQPNVKFVNYFYKDYAVHGNYWRPASVFGNVNTSHGCIGITDSDAEWLYNWAPIGTTVITHS